MIQQQLGGQILTLRLAHGKVSALDKELCVAVRDAFRAAPASGARAIVFTGTGSTFSAGVDLFRIIEGGASYIGPFLDLMDECFEAVFTCPLPVIVAINGHAIAGGCIFAGCGDYRVMAQGRGRIGAPELAVGVPFPPLPLEILRLYTPPQFLPRIVNAAETFLPDDALRIGLVDEVVAADSLVPRAQEMAQRMAGMAATSFALVKRQMRDAALLRVKSLTHIAKDVRAHWTSPEVLTAIQVYLNQMASKAR